MQGQPLQQLEKIKTWLKDNPYRSHKVAPIEIRVESDTQEGEDVAASIPGGLIPTPLEPPGPVSLYLWKTDPEFRAATSQVRRTILRDAILKLTDRVDKELRGVKWSRKKVLEQLAAQQTSAVSPPMDTPELDAALAHLFGYQKVVLDEANKKVHFFPRDPRTWSAELPIWGGTAGARAVVHGRGETSVGAGLSSWLGQREKEGWKIDWVEAEGTLEDIKAKMAQKGLGVGAGAAAAGSKPKKADWALALGRAEILDHLLFSEGPQGSAAQ